MVKQELINEVAAETGEMKRTTEIFLNTFLTTIAAALVKGEEVTIYGFGKFSISQRAAREGRNPATGKPIKIKAKKNIRFKAHKKLADEVNG